MAFRTVSVSNRSARSDYEVRIGPGLLDECGEWAREALGSDVQRIAVISNRKVFGLYGERAMHSLEGVGFQVSVIQIPDGERYKTLKTAQEILSGLEDLKFGRNDTVAALGGGVIGDIAGFAASIYLRGIRYLQLPTTVVSMVDSSVGGKTGVNTKTGKNLIGSFHRPSGVLADVSVLATLPRRELTSGFCEIAKQAILAGGRLFEQTQTILREFSPTAVAKSLHLRDLDAFSSLIAEQVSFKAWVVTEDEQEAVKKTGPRSRKILNFGHTIGHALEKATNYKALRHGEAVGYGMMFAADLSKKLEFMPPEQVELLYDVVRRCGSFPRLKNVNPADVSEALESDKKRINGSLQWILLRGIGKPTIVPDDQIPQDIFQSTLIDLLER